MKTLSCKLKQPACFAVVCLFLAGGFASRVIAADATNSIVWHAETGTLDVDIDNKPLSVVAADFKKATGREIHVPPGMTKTVSVKFSGKTVSESLSRILDGFNYYADTKGGNGASRIVIVDPSDASPVPSLAKPAMNIPRPPPPPGTMAFRPTGTPGTTATFVNGAGRSDDRGSGGTTGGGDRDRRPRTPEEMAMELLVREAAKASRDGNGSSGGGGDSRSRYSSGSPGRPDGGSSSGKSRSPR